MRVEPIRILQIGDIHYPGAIESRPSADLKRDPFDISEEVSPRGARIRKIVQSFSAYDIGYFDAIFFMGDFTTGNPNTSLQMQSMERCFDYLDLNIIAPLLGKRSRERCLFVPGNHDVDRTRCPSAPTARLDKFEQYMTLLLSRGHQNHSTNEISIIDISKDGASALIHGINTCLGCGEFLSFPTELKNDLVSHLAHVIKPDATQEATEVVSKFLDLTERLDAPLVDGDILQRLDSSLDRYMHERTGAVQLVVGHHNLLPQTVPRVAPFGELVNSGELRSFLATKNAPILYLHGHIHNDPLEIVFSQSNPASCVISISAPEFIDGYNVIELHFDEEGTPLGLVVQTIRQDQVGRISRPEPRRIPFRQGPHRIAAITYIAREIFYKTFSKNTQLHFNDVVREYPGEDENKIELALLELEWLGLIQIANRTRAPKHWNINSAV